MKKITLLFTFLLAFAFQGYSQFSDSFEAGILPTWTVVNGGDTNQWEAWEDDSLPIDAHTGSHVVRISYSSDAHDDYLITPQFTVTAGISNQLSLWANNASAAYPESFDILISTTGTNPANFAAALTGAPVTPPEQTWQKYTYNLNAYVGQTVYIAFRSATTNMNELYLDDIMVNAIPLTPPVCITNPVSTINPTCGNFASSITWDMTTDADGYYLTIGTTPGGTDIVNSQDMGLNNNYILNSPTANTTYYWKAVPYNIIGSSVGCLVNSFTTAAAPCFCAPNPSSVDGSGITNVTIGTINNTTGTETNNYGDFSAMVTNVYQGLNTPISITYQTGYTYETKVWIDWNNDYDFEDVGEEIFSGTSTADNPTTLTIPYSIPVTAPLGNHRMRIGGVDSGPITPCYEYSYGSFEDYTINVAVATCTPAAATKVISFDCPNNRFFAQVNVTALGSGTPSITDGTTTWPVTATGVVQVGPFPFGTPVTLTLQHGSNPICDIALGTSNYAACPPTNDECTSAIPLTLGGSYSANIANGSNSQATASPEAATTCFGFFGGDVWYSVIVPPSGNITIETGDTSAGNAPAFDSVISIYSGVCGSLTHIDCDDDGAATGGYSLKAITGQTPGTTLYVRVFEYFNDSVADFGIAAYDTSLSTPSFGNADGLSVFPNPATDVLNIAYTSVISKIAIYNLLGQEVLNRSINATQSQVDISSLTNGTYLVKVEVDGLIKTLKIVKSN
ncbi:choice-of-anchor J domain-containing protein [Flavobacterium sp.]|uniref:T9SS type A sorting domain-containing protein n=1 Tax=Flavobacterium sp. TaxID=239 RepID=UPI003D6AC199